MSRLIDVDALMEKSKTSIVIEDCWASSKDSITINRNYFPTVTGTFATLSTTQRRLKCKYCDCMNDKDYGKCSYCGAPLKE